MTPGSAYYRRMNSRLQRLVAASSIAVLALGMSACSSDDKKTESDKSSTPSATPSEKEQAAAAPSAEQLAIFTAITDAQAKAGSAHVVMDIGSGAEEISAVGDLVFGEKADDTAMSVAVEMAGNKEYSLAMTVLDGALYVNLGKITGGKYGKVDLAAADNDSVAMQFTPLTKQLDPSQQLVQVKRSVKSFGDKGAPEKIDGVMTQSYELVLVTAKLAGMADAPEGTPKTMTQTLFVGPDNLLRRMVTGVGGAKVQIDYSAWGEPVNIKAPRSSQISATALDKLRG